jgi:adenylate cyclase
MAHLGKGVTLGVLIGLLGLVATLTPFGLAFEEGVGLPLLFKLRGPRPAPDDVVIVGIDERSAAQLDLPHDPARWPRLYHAQLIDRLVDAGAAVIVFDMLFREPRLPEHDTRLAEAMRRARNVVLFDYLKQEGLAADAPGQAPMRDLHIQTRVPPLPLLAQAALTSAPFPLPKVPVRVSQYWTFKTGAGDVPTLPAMALQIFALPAYEDFRQLLERVSPAHALSLPRHRDALRAADLERFVYELRALFVQAPELAARMLAALHQDGTPWADRRTQRLLTALIRLYQGTDSRYLNFYGPPGTIATVPYAQVLQGQASTQGQRPFDLSGKAVFVGLSERRQPEHKDGFYTVFSQPSGIDLSGVEIAATAFANLLDDRHLQPLSWPWHLAAVMFWGVALGVLCRPLPTTLAVVSALGLGALYGLAAYRQFESVGRWWPLLVPLVVQLPGAMFGAVLGRYVETNRERQHIRKLFGYYLPDDIVDGLLNNLGDIKTSDQLVYGVCLCTDAERYTAVAEKLDPRELTAFMNRYYEAVFAPVQRHGGVVSDVVGDAMLAIWTTVQPDADQRQRACLAALDIASAVQRFNRSAEHLQLPTRIGLHSGTLVLGHLGASPRYEYRAVGDIVNTATRIQGLNKYLRTHILASAEVLQHLDGFLTRELGSFLFVGKSQPQLIYELICRLAEATPEQQRRCADFAKALDAYKRQAWDEAIEGFEACLTRYGMDGPALFYRRLCERHRAAPPGRRGMGSFG